MTGDKILYVQYTNPAAYPSLEHSSRQLANAGWQVLFLGIEMPEVRALKFHDHPNVEVRLMRPPRSGVVLKLHYVLFALWACAHSVRRRPAWLYASDRLSCPATLMASIVSRVPVAYHEHDTPNPDGRGVESSWVDGLLTWCRRRLARRSRIVIFPNGERARALTDALGAGVNARCVWNCPALEDVSQPRDPLKEGDLWAIYQGSIVPARLPLSVIDALTLLPDNVKLCVVGYETAGHPGYGDDLWNRARQFGLQARVELLGPMKRADLLEVCRRSDIGLSLLPIDDGDPAAGNMTGASVKPFEYLACGVALLVSDLPDWKGMFVEPGYGLACDPGSPESIAEALLWFFRHPEEMRAMGERGRQRIISEWNYETQFEPVLRELLAESTG